MNQNVRGREPGQQEAPVIPGMIWDPERRRYFPSQTLRDPLRKAQSNSLSHLDYHPNKLADSVKAARQEHLQLPQSSNAMRIETFRRQNESGQTISNQSKNFRHVALLMHLRLSICVTFDQGSLNTFQDIVSFSDGQVLATLSDPLETSFILSLYQSNGEEPIFLGHFNGDNSSMGYYLLSASEDGSKATIFSSNSQEIIMLEWRENKSSSTSPTDRVQRRDDPSVLNISNNLWIKGSYRATINSQTRLNLLAISEFGDSVVALMNNEKKLLVVRFLGDAVSGQMIKLPNKIFSSDILSLAIMESFLNGKQETLILMGTRSGLIVVVSCADLFKRPFTTQTRTLKEECLSGYIKFGVPVSCVRPIHGTSYIVVAGCRNQLCLYDIRYLKDTARGLNENEGKVLDYDSGYYNDLDVHVAFAFAPSTYGGNGIFAISSTDSTVQIYDAIRGTLLVSLDLSYMSLKSCSILTPENLKKLFFPGRSERPKPLRVRNLAWTQQQLIINVEAGLLYWQLGSIL